MKRRRVILISAAALTLVTLLALAFWPRQREPEYEGHKLSWWLAVALSVQRAQASPGMYPLDHTREAVRAIGTNGLPYMQKAIAYETPSWRTNLPQIVYNLPFVGSHFINDGNEFNAEATVWGFEALGNEAQPAVTELGRIVRTTHWPMTQGRAARALAAIGDAGVLELMAALQDPRTKIKDFIVVGIFQAGRQGVDVRNAVPVLLANMNDHESGLMARSALLDLTRQNRAMYLPIVIRCLHHTNEPIRAAAATVLTIHTNVETSVRNDAEHVLAEADPALVHRLWPERAAATSNTTLLK